MSLLGIPSPPETASTLTGVQLEMKGAVRAELEKFRGTQPGAKTA